MAEQFLLTKHEYFAVWHNLANIYGNYEDERYHQ